MPNYFLNNVQILLNVIHILSKFCPNIVQIVSKLYTNIIQILSKYFPNIVQILSKYYPKQCLFIVQILSKYYPNIVQILSKYCPNIIQILFNYYPNIIQLIFKYCQFQNTFCLLKTVLIYGQLQGSLHLWCSYFCRKLFKGQKSKIARIFVLLVFAITLYWHIEKNNTGLVSGQLKKTDASILGRCVCGADTGCR